MRRKRTATGLKCASSCCRIDYHTNIYYNSYNYYNYSYYCNEYGV